MTAAVACTAVILVLIGCMACGVSFLAGHERPGCLRRAIGIRVAGAVLRVLIAVLSVAGAVRGGVVRARWAWLCRKPPARSEGKLNRADYLTFTGLVETWRQSGTAERSRT